jgi:signal transduction histidine kinase/DNA-binding response OmpR family regulator
MIARGEKKEFRALSMWNDGWLVVATLSGATIIGAAMWLRKLAAQRRIAANIQLEALRDEIWELRAAAADRDRAEAASIAKSRFLATVSHEIRTPLNGILGLAQLLAMTPLSAEQASYIDAIRASSRSLAQLIDDILDFSKIEAGKFEIRREPFLLAPAIEGAVELLAPRAQDKNLEIASLISPEAPERITGDAARLRQVLINLIGNAVSFTQAGGVGVRVSLGVSNELLFEVADTGPGVPQQLRETIFEEFEQADASASRCNGGAGLGLAISRRIVERMGGRLNIAETSANGTIFAFNLPLGFDSRTPTESNSALRSTYLADVRVLIVAGSVFEAPFMAAILRAVGAEVEIVADAKHGLARLRQEPFNAVIVDCALGEDATERLAAAAGRARVDRIFLLFSPLERRAFGEAALGRYDGWLVKPVRANSLIERLSSAPLQPQQTSLLRLEPTLRGLKILLAEDNDVNALIVSRYLEKLGASVERVDNGAKAVDLTKAAVDGVSERFDVILMDLFMPQLDGFEATQRIRLNEARAHASRTPILALTASAFEEDQRAAHAAGADAMLAKPVDLEALVQTIERLCVSKRAVVD